MLRNSNTPQLINFSPSDLEMHQQEKAKNQRSGKSASVEEEDEDAKKKKEGPKFKLKRGATSKRFNLEKPFREGEEPMDDQTLLFGTQTGSIVFMQAGPEPKMIANFKDAHEAEIKRVFFCEAIARLVR